MKDFYKNKSILNVSSQLLQLKDLIEINENYDSSYFLNYNLAKSWIHDNKLDLGKLPYLEYDKILSIKATYPKNYIDIINSKIVYLEPTNIPIIREQNNLFYGQFVPIYLDDDCDKLIISEYRLSKKDSVYLPGIYIHEIIHSVIENNNFSINNFIDYELIPMIYEFLYANDFGIDVLNLFIRKRFNLLYKYIEWLQTNNKLLQLYSSSYINAIIISYQFIELYRIVNNSVKVEILYDLREILHDNQCIKNVLDKYNLSYESALEKILLQKHLKVI